MHRAMDRLLTKEYKEGIEKDEEQSLTRSIGAWTVHTTG